MKRGGKGDQAKSDFARQGGFGGYERLANLFQYYFKSYFEPKTSPSNQYSNKFKAGTMFILFSFLLLLLWGEEKRIFLC